MDPGVALRVAYLHWSCACFIHLLSSSANNGFPKPSSMPASDGTKRGTKCGKRGTKRDTATEHAKQPVVLKCNLQTLYDKHETEAARADRADDTLEQLLYKLAEFLRHVLRALCCSDLHLS